MIVKKLRLKNNWSQEQLSQFSGLSVRTIQRIEKGEKVGLETLKSLAAVFEVELDDLQQQVIDMSEETQHPVHERVRLTLEEQRAMEYVQELKAFYGHLMSFCLVMPVIFLVNYLVSPWYYWAFWALMGWGIGITAHALSVFEVFKVFGPEWEKKQIEKRLGRKL